VGGAGIRQDGRDVGPRNASLGWPKHTYRTYRTSSVSSRRPEIWNYSSKSRKAVRNYYLKSRRASGNYDLKSRSLSQKVASPAICYLQL
jgi:hypothetical protein